MTTGAVMGPVHELSIATLVTNKNNEDSLLEPVLPLVTGMGLCYKNMFTVDVIMPAGFKLI